MDVTECCECGPIEVLRRNRNAISSALAGIMVWGESDTRSCLVVSSLPALSLFYLHFYFVLVCCRMVAEHRCRSIGSHSRRGFSLWRRLHRWLLYVCCE